MLRFLATVVLTACIAARVIEATGKYDSVDPMLTWTKTGVTTTCAGGKDLKGACEAADAANCDKAAPAPTADTASCNKMCEAFGKAYNCGMTQNDLDFEMDKLNDCATTTCKIEGDVTAGEKRNECVTKKCIKFIDPTEDSVEGFVAWVTDSSGLKAACKKSEDKRNLKEDCMNEQTKGQNWTEMCTALGENFPCDQSKGATMASCCGTTCQDAENFGDSTKEDCCVTCIEATATTVAPTTGPATGPSPGPAPTTAKPPAPGPAPPSDTTTMESTSTEEGGSDDSAFALGPSGLLVTLITLMAVVNIA